MEINESIHIPVLLDEVIDMLKAQQGGLFLDCTLGGAGHTQAILNANKANKVVACDRDSTAVERASLKFSNESRLTIHFSSFAQIGELFKNEKFDGILADLGMSTDQLKGQRGFSFDDDVALDMRMDQSQSLSALRLVNEYSEREIFTALKRGGVGNEAKSIAKKIVAMRPLHSTKELAEIVRSVSDYKSNQAKDSSAVVFQAIRIEVNNEFEQIQALLNAVPQVSKNGTRLAVISFHSLEDELVTKRMRQWAAGDTAPAWMQSEKSQSKQGLLLTKKAIVPSEEEIKRNPASRSARLRVFEFNN